jgi:hypothetical protein
MEGHMTIKVCKSCIRIWKVTVAVNVNEHRRHSSGMPSETWIRRANNEAKIRSRYASTDV